MVIRSASGHIMVGLWWAAAGPYKLFEYTINDTVCSRPTVDEGKAKGWVNTHIHTHINIELDLGDTTDNIHA